MSPAEAHEVDVLVIAGSGVGHFHPVAAFAERLAAPGRTVVAAELRAGHPVRGKLAADGIRLVEWSAPSEHGTLDRALTVARRSIVRRVTPRLARRGSASEPLPGLAARMTFALASLLRPIEESRASRGEQLDTMLRELRPRLVLSEGYDDWLEVLCAHHGVAWARYTTGPVAELSPRRPTEPAGLDPDLRGAEGVANTALLGLRRARAGLGRRRVQREAARMGREGEAPPVERLAFSCAELDDNARVRTTWTYAGLSPYRAPDGWSSPPAPTARDTVLVTWGSGRVGGERDLLDRLLPVLAELTERFRVVVQSGDEELRRHVAEVLGDRSGAVVQAPDRDPQYGEYRRARLVIGHGGYGTINETVAFGSPVLVLPELVADRMETARRVQHAGVGASLNRYTATTASLRDTIEALLGDADVQRSVDRVGAALRDRGPSEQLLSRMGRHLVEAGEDDQPELDPRGAP